MSTSIIFIGTNRYIDFFPTYYASIKKNLIFDDEIKFHVFTDKIEFCIWPNDVKVYQIEHKHWPFITLLRYSFINKFIEEICKSRNCIFVDADMVWKTSTNEYDLFRDKRHFGVQHPGFVFNPAIATFERNIKSKAYVSCADDTSVYWQGCLWGAKSEEFYKMIKTLDFNVDLDLKNQIVATWHDESHLNRYFIDFKSDVNTLHPGYATPENYHDLIRSFPTIAVHLDKSMSDFPRFPGVKK